MEEVDVLIIGSGPAGISTALHLLQIDPAWARRMVVLEKSQHPRPKLCGGGVTRLGLGMLQSLGFKLPLPLPQARVDDVRFHYAGHTIHVRGRPQFVVFYRPELDAYLASQAQQRGVDLRQDEGVLSLEQMGERVRVQTRHGEYAARVIVGADGSKGITRRMFSRRGENSHVARLLETITPAAEQEPIFRERYARFDFTAARQALQGYTWDFPARPAGEPSYNRGIYDARLDEQRPKANLPRLLKRYLPPYRPEALQGHPVHWFNPWGQFARPHILLAGDSAGADPLLGEGIAPALAYGKVAAETIAAAFQKRDFRFQDYRRRVLSSRLGVYLLLRWISASVCYRLSGKARFMRLLWKLGSLLARLWPEPANLYEEAEKPDKLLGLSDPPVE